MWSDLRYRLRAVFRRSVVERELDAELGFHLERQAEKHRQSGMSPDDAKRQARLDLGGSAIAEQCRDARGLVLVETLIQDIRYALRLFRKSPVFTAVTIGSLALGIGANTAIFSLMDAVMWRSLPIEDPAGLMSAGALTYDQFEAAGREADGYELAGYSPVRLNVRIDGISEPAADGQLVSGNFFSLLGVSAVIGRTITPEDDRIPRGHPVAVLSHGYWSRRFDRDPAMLGRTISLSGTSFTVIGITSPGFTGVEAGLAPDIFVPMMMQPDVMPASENLIESPILYATWIEGLVRLDPGTSESQAEGALQLAYDQHAPPDKFGTPVLGRAIQLEPIPTGLSKLRDRFGDPLVVLMTLVAVVLLVACTNTANMLLARAARRQGEFAVRLALGASRRRLTRQLLVESLLLGLAGGVVAIPLARAATELLVLYVSVGQSPVYLELDPNLKVLAFTAAVSIISGVLFGLAPAFWTRRIRLTRGTQVSRTVTNGSGKTGPRRVLSIAQIAMSLVLLVGGSLFVRSLQNLWDQSRDLAPSTLLVGRVEPVGSDQRGIPGTTERLNRIYNELLDRVRAIPGVRSATMGNVSPTKPESGCCGYVDLETGALRRIEQIMVYPDYFETLGLPLIAGRNFDAADFRENSVPVVVINETWARMRFPGEDPVGQALGTGSSATIVGVVQDVRYTNLRGSTPAMYYAPFLTAGGGRGQMILHVRAARSAESIIGPVRRAMSEVDPDVPQFALHTLSEEIDAVLVQERLIGMLSGLFSALALALASIGLYGLMSFTVAGKTPEIGLRMALGARGSAILGTVLWEGIFLVAAGIAIGLGLAVAATRIAGSRLSGLLFGVDATTPGAIAPAVAILIVVTLVAIVFPARRASRVDPVVALRNE